MTTIEEFTSFVRETIPLRLQLIVTEDEIQAVACNLMNLHDFDTGKRTYPFGSFMEAIARRNFYDAFKHADAGNIILMSVYASYIYNYSPMTL
jgi:hypothetical protein